MSEFRLQRHGAVDLIFDGVLIADVSSDDGLRERWEVIHIFRTATGKYVVERLGETRIAGEVTMRHVHVLDDVAGVRERLTRHNQQQRPYLTTLALEALDQAEKNDTAFGELAERI